MLTMEISLGHSASHSRSLVQLPKPKASIVFNILIARLAASGRPWGSRARWDILAPVNSMAEALGHEATQAPQPMQAAASMAFSAAAWGTGMALASWAPPVMTDTKPPACIMTSKALRSTARSLMIGKALARQGSMTTVSPSEK